MTAHPAAEGAERPTNRPIVVFGCSALKRSYRDLLRGFAVEQAPHDEGVQAYFVYRACWGALDQLCQRHVGVRWLGSCSCALPLTCLVRGTRDLLLSRMSRRQGHFMKASMLDSQLATLEEPAADEDDYGGVMVIDLTDDVDDVLARTEAAVRHALDVAGPRRPAPASPPA